jgi:putative membrane protein
MKENIVLVVKGFIMGIANVIPGVSGGTLALTLGIYEKFITAISHFFSNLKENIKFLIPIAIGMVLAIITMSSLITECFEKFPVPTSTFFMGLVIGGVPLLTAKIKGKKEVKQISSYIIMALTFSLVLFLALSPSIFGETGDVKLGLNLGNIILLFLVGMIASATMVIPGVSGSLVLMLLGFYFPILNTIKSFLKFNNFMKDFMILAVFGLGILIGIVLVAKLIEYLFEKFETKTYFGVIGFILASIIAIPISVNNELGSFVLSFVPVLVGLVTMAIGIFIGFKLGEK